MSTLNSIIRKLNLVPKEVTILNPLYREIIDCYYGKDYIEVCKKIEKQNIENDENINRYLLCDNSENPGLDWSLSISILKPKNSLYYLDNSHIKLLNGKLNCESDSLKFKLSKGSISIPKTHSKRNFIFL